MARAYRQRGRVGDVDDGGGRIDQVEHRGHVERALPDRPVHHPQQVERPEQLREQRRHEHDIARGCEPAAPPPHDEAHAACEHQVGDQRLTEV